MMLLIERNTVLWQYLSEEIQGLISDGETLVNFVISNDAGKEISDHSFMVFPFAKAYEGYLKKLFLDIGMIKPDEYYSDDIRIGRILNPRYQAEKGNVFSRMCEHSPNRRDLSQKLWDVWKSGRNEIFHYFPHNFKKLNFDEAMTLIKAFVDAMEAAVSRCEMPESKLHPIRAENNNSSQVSSIA